MEKRKKKISYHPNSITKKENEKGQELNVAKLKIGHQRNTRFLRYKKDSNFF